jgi:hypothetical protein
MAPIAAVQPESRRVAGMRRLSPRVDIHPALALVRWRRLAATGAGTTFSQGVSMLHPVVKAGVIAACVLAIGGVAYATIPDNGVISACYLKSGGTLRVVDATTSKCSPKETSLNWNVQGPAGEDGEDGEDGVDGAPGLSGYELVTAETTDIDPFEGNRLDVFAKCPAGKSFVGGGYAFYLVPPGFAPQYTPAERINALPEVDGDGIHQYVVTVIHAIPQGYAAKLKATIACASVAT